MRFFRHCAPIASEQWRPLGERGSSRRLGTARRRELSQLLTTGQSPQLFFGGWVEAPERVPRHRVDSRLRYTLDVPG
jgi:hypothetical protein